MYKAAPIHTFYEGIEMKLEKSKAEISLPIDSHHVAGVWLVPM